MNGEPFVSKNLSKYAKEIGYKYVFITINGALADSDSIKDSINGGSKETYKKIYGRDDYDKVIANLKFACEYKRKKNLNIKMLSSFVVTKYIKEEIEELRAEINNIKVPKYKKKNKLSCPELFRTICVTAEGYLTLCCSEALNYLVVEDLNNMTLLKAWHSKRMKKIRQKHL